jgi:hypothetical protein
MSKKQNSTDQWRNHPRRAEVIRLSHRLKRLCDRREVPPSKEFTPTQAVILKAINCASLRFEAHESTLLRRTLEELAEALDQWATANRPDTRSLESVHNELRGNA